MAKGKKTGGRRKGVPNKFSGQLKDMILRALDESGGVDYLVRCANAENPAPFLALVGKVLPLTVPKVESGSGLTINLGFLHVAQPTQSPSLSVRRSYALSEHVEGIVEPVEVNPGVHS